MRVLGVSAFLILLASVAACKDTNEQQNNTDSMSETESREVDNLGFAIGITPDNFPYLEFFGNARFTYTTNASRFEASVSKSGKTIAKINGSIKFDYESEVFLLDCDVEADQPIDVKILGTKSIESELEFSDGLIVFPSGEHAIQAKIVFEYAYEWN